MQRCRVCLSTIHLLVSSPSKRLEGDAFASSTLGCPLRIKLSPSEGLEGGGYLQLPCTHRMSYSFKEEGGRQSLMGRPSVGIVGGVIWVATDLLFAKTVWLPIDVIHPPNVWRGVRRRSPTTTTKGETARGCNSHEVVFPWVRVGVEEPQLDLLAPVNGPRNIMRRQTARRPPPFAHVPVGLNLFLVVGLQGRMLRGEHKVAFPPPPKVRRGAAPPSQRGCARFRTFPPPKVWRGVAHPPCHCSPRSSPWRLPQRRHHQ